IPREASIFEAAPPERITHEGDVVTSDFICGRQAPEARRDVDDIKESGQWADNEKQINDTAGFDTGELRPDGGDLHHARYRTGRALNRQRRRTLRIWMEDPNGGDPIHVAIWRLRVCHRIDQSEHGRRESQRSAERNGREYNKSW